jgi:hypothetical protein
MNNSQDQGFLKRKINQTHMVNREDVERFQKGDWENVIAERTRNRDHVLPFWRGGPILVGPHSWAVRKLLGVRVYQARPR